MKTKQSYYLLVKDPLKTLNVLNLYLKLCACFFAIKINWK